MNTEEVNPRKGEDNYQFLFGNMKVLMDNAIAHSQEVMSISKQGLQESVDLQKKINDQYLAREQQIREHNGQTFSQKQEHENEIETTRQENMRFTLKHLYDGVAEALVDQMKKEGLVEKKG